MIDWPMMMAVAMASMMMHDGQRWKLLHPFHEEMLPLLIELI